jgi:transposase
MSKTNHTIPMIPSDQRSIKPCRRRFTEAFRRDAVRLVTHEGYSFQAAAAAVGVSQNCLRDWHKQHAPAPQPCGPDASVEQLQDEVRQLRRQLKRAEMEREILKKATAYFAKESS